MTYPLVEFAGHRTQMATLRKHENATGEQEFRHSLVGKESAQLVAQMALSYPLTVTAVSVRFEDFRSNRQNAFPLRTLH